MEKYKSKFRETIMGDPAWCVVDDQGDTLAMFMMSMEFNGEAKAKHLADEMNREAAMVDIKSWDEKIYQAQCNINKVAVALLDMKGMLGFNLKNKDLAAKFDIAEAYNRLIEAMGLLNITVDELPSGEDIEKAQEILSGSKNESKRIDTVPAKNGR